MPSRLALVTVIALTTGCSRQPSSEPSATSSPAELELRTYADKLQQELPTGWTLATTPASINVRRIVPVAYYIPEVGLPPMSKEEEALYIERHTRVAVLEIRLRFAPPISPAETTRLAHENEQLVQRAEKEFPNTKGNAVHRYLEAHPDQKLNELPAFQTASHSVYSERPVRCEWLRDATIKGQCDTVDRAIAKLFGS